MDDEKPKEKQDLPDYLPEDDDVVVNEKVRFNYSFKTTPCQSYFVFNFCCSMQFLLTRETIYTDSITK